MKIISKFQDHYDIGIAEDKYLTQGKCFDCYSFKKMPSKRREKKCKVVR